MTTRRLLSTLAVTATLAGGIALPALTGAAAQAAPTAQAAPGTPVDCAPVLDDVETPAVEVLADTGDVPEQPANPALVDALTETVAAAAADEAQNAAHDDEAELWLDECGKAFYKDEVVPAAERGNTVGTSTQLYPLDDTFALHSRPGSSRTIYLDFDGHTLTNTAWNASQYGGAATVELSPYSMDASPAFSDAEKVAIQNVWEIVAEDYAPFDVDVTTELPAPGVLERSGSGDNVFGTRAVVTNDEAGQAVCGCGGVAYVGVFNDHTNHEYYQPALAFTRGVGTSAKPVAEVISHEVGHNLGLSHQGTGSAGYYNGHNPWAPIMGAGYYQPMTQWARGQYSGANNNQDEYAVMQTYGTVARADDYGNNTATAHEITEPLSSTPVVRTGVISSAADVDAFKFTLADAATIDVGVTTNEVAPNLDVELRLYSSTGALVVSDNPDVVASGAAVVSGTGAALDAVTLPAGTYTVTVDGSGFRTPTTGYSDYGSLGTYTLALTGQAAVGPVPTIVENLEPVTTNVAYSVQLEHGGAADPDAVWSLVSGKLPQGLTLSPTGLISGRTGAVGSFRVTVGVTDGGGATSAREVILNVAPPVAVNWLSTNEAPVAGQPFAATLRISGGVTPYVVTADEAPDWATVSPDGVITGTPTRAENAQFTVTVSDVDGRTTTVTRGAYVDGPVRVETEELPFENTVVAGRSNSFKLTAVGGTRSYTWLPTASVLPTGATLTSTGTVTVKDLEPGDHTIQVAVRDTAGVTATAVFTLTALPPLDIEASKPGAVVGVPFELTLTPSGGDGDHTVTTGTLPTGWTFDGTTVSGVSTKATSLSVAVSVEDGLGRKESKTVTFAVRSAVTVSTFEVPVATRDKAISTTTLRALGGSGSYTWAVTDGELPEGLALAATGALTGTPTEDGAFDVTVEATDTEGRTATRELTVTVVPPVEVTSDSLPSTTVGQAFSVQLEATGGSGSYKFTATGLPTGVVISATGVVSGTPRAAGTRAVTVKATDSAGRTATRVLSLVTVK